MAVDRHRRIGVRRLTGAALSGLLLAGCGRSKVPTGPNIPPNLVAQARAHFEAGRYEDAAAQFERFVQAYPARLDARKYWAYALAALGRFDEVDRALRTAPRRPTAAADGTQAEHASRHTAPADPQATLMLWRRAFNIYRYYYHVTSPQPSGVFRAGAIRDALEAQDLGDLTSSDLPQVEPLRLEELLDLLQLWVRWDQVARDADLFPHRQWVPLLVVAEPERLRDLLDQLAGLEQQTAGAVWLHPDDQGNWLAHPGVIDAEALPLVRATRRGAVTDELTETAGPGADLVEAWGELARWLGQHVPRPAITVVAAIRPEFDHSFDRRLVLAGRMMPDGRLHVQRIGAAGPAEAVVNGYAEYRRLRRAEQVTARSSVEIESLAGAYAAAGMAATAFHVDEQGYIFADDRMQLARLLSFVRYGGALFGRPVVMTPSPSE